MRTRMSGGVGGAGVSPAPTQSTDPPGSGQIRKHKAGVLAAIKLGINNGRLEALNSRVRLISHRAHGFHSPQALIAMVYLCCADIQIGLPHR